MSVDRLAAALADRYTIERELGQGGMATVYVAQDLKHHRRVAIKVLRPELAAMIGAERFLAEIKTTANLQHPHILPLFDSGEADGFLFYVMPFVEGETLRDRLARETQLGIRDAVRITIEVASALDYAHRHGVIHRDIKPANILLHDGRALVADFGIALAASTAGSRMTETGMSLGTPHYMSPEQAMGERDLDARTDIYALGCVSYEMLTGVPPFDGPTAQAIVAKAMTGAPTPPSVTRDTVPEQVEDAVLQALARLRVDRFGTAAEFAAAVEGVGAARITPRPMPAGRGARRTTTRSMVSLAAVTLAAGGILGWALGRGSRGTAGPQVYDAALPDSASMSFAATTSNASYGLALRNLSISPDGRFAVYTAQEGDSTSLWYRGLQDDEVHPIPGTSGGKAPRISPDGSEVAFLVGEHAMLVPIGGGEPRQLLASQATIVTAWVSPSELLVVDATGTRANWIDPDGGGVRSESIPRCLEGTWVTALRILTCSGGRVGRVIDPDSGTVTKLRSVGSEGAPGLPVTGTNFRVVGDRYLVFVASDGSLRATTYDPATHRVGRAVTMVRGIRREAFGPGQFDLSANGTLVFAPGEDATIGRLVRLGRDEGPGPLPVEPADFQRFDLSRDGRWLAAAVQGPQSSELRIYDLRDRQHFTWFRSNGVRHLLWDAEGHNLLFALDDTTTSTILWGAPGSGTPADTLAVLTLQATTPDPIDLPGKRLALAQDWEGGVVMTMDPTVVPVHFDSVLTGARFPSVAPGGGLIAYQTTEGSRVMVTAFPAPGRRWQVASEGVEPLWLSRSEVLYRQGVSWYVARVDPGTGEPLGPPTRWGRDPRFSDTSGWSNRLSHDGGIIYVQGSEETSASHLRVIPNWVAQMKAAVDEANR